MNHPTEHRRRRTGAQVEELLTRYHASGQTQAQFVQSEGICLATLARHLKRAWLSGSEAQPSTAARFIELERGGAISNSRGDAYRLSFSHGVEL